MANLFILYLKTKELIDSKQLKYRAKASQKTRKHRQAERNNPLLEELALKISYKALDLVGKQFRLAKAARLGLSPLSLYLEAFIK